MMFATMRAQGLYPPFYFSRRDSIVVLLLNEERPPIWEQVSNWIDRNGFITNGQLCGIASVDTLKASKMLKKWVGMEMLEVDMSKGKKNARYRKAGSAAERKFIGLLSGLSDNKKSSSL
jgi:ATP-dependent DNA helicase RecG